LRSFSTPDVYQKPKTREKIVVAMLFIELKHILSRTQPSSIGLTYDNT